MTRVINSLKNEKLNSIDAPKSLAVFLPGRKVKELPLFDGSKQPNHSISNQKHEENLQQTLCRRKKKIPFEQKSGFDLGMFIQKFFNVKEDPISCFITCYTFQKFSFIRLF